jgi:hypothetical protein
MPGVFCFLHRLSTSTHHPFRHCGPQHGQPSTGRRDNGSYLRLGERFSKSKNLNFGEHTKSQCNMQSPARAHQNTRAV